jgi:hypothetical protein
LITFAEVARNCSFFKRRYSMLVDHSTRIIPKREPELMSREAHRLHGGDMAEVPTTSLDRIFVRGAELRSRHQRADEFEVMRAMVLALGPAMSLAVESIDCDSARIHGYTVRIWDWAWKPDVVDHIGKTLDAVVFCERDFHSGITMRVTGGSGECVNRAASWQRG